MAQTRGRARLALDEPAEVTGVEKRLFIADLNREAARLDAESVSLSRADFSFEISYFKSET